MDLDKDVKYVKTVGPNRVKLLNKLNIYTLKDLITYYPRDYEDRSKPKNLYECVDGEEVLIEAMATARISEMHKGRMTISKLVVKDQTGTCYITWFNQGYLRDKFQPGRMYRFFGKISVKGSRFEMNSPVYDEIDQSKNTGKIIPIYPLTYELKQNTLRRIIENGLLEVKGQLEETLPDYIIKENELWNINKAIERIHFPHEFSDFNKARERLVFEELLTTQLALLKLKNNYEHNRNGIQFNKDVKMSDVIDTLPFKLTKAQLRVLEEIDNDMESDKTMNRLLQGDVGSGKTVVAIIAAYKAVKSGYQTAIMAPTAILASQHLESFKEILEKYGMRIELLVSSVTKKKKNEILEKLQQGEIDILIGTHAMLEENVVFKNLGLIVTDEQHRFGVNQRKTIALKAKNPDVIAMSATPIPRTLALILYGDLDISIIDELPPNRKKIETYAVRKNFEERVNNFIKKELDNGRQAYIVCPLVEENDEMELKSVIELAEKEQKETFSNYKVAYLHGKMKTKEKDEIMQNFKDGKIQILFATTVIEVGVNVPNASIMVVENAERFGLAQLHQLRGRVGRGEYQSYCILKYEGNGEKIRQRMKVMCDTNDGFIISEKDLELRGSGDFFGTEQHGLPEFKIANLFEDVEILKKVQKVSIKIIEKDPLLTKEENQKLNELVKEKFDSRIEI